MTTTPNQSTREEISGEVVHFISAAGGRKANVTACGKVLRYPMRGNGWRVSAISCPECDRLICDLAHAHLSRSIVGEGE